LLEEFYDWFIIHLIDATRVDVIAGTKIIDADSVANKFLSIAIEQEIKDFVEDLWE
jgi:hypothetical protein